MNKRNRFVSLSRVVEDALAEMENLSSVQRIIPIAWPVFEVEFELCLRLEEELGLVERHILEAVACVESGTPQEIGAMMGLEGEIVEDLVGKLERFPGAILRDGENLRRSEDLLDRLSENRWAHETIQPYRFWVNGPRGKLLPIKSIGESTSDIVVDYENGGLVISRAGQQLKTMYWIAPSQGKGVSHLEQLLQDSDQKSRTRFGIPEGAFALDSSNALNGNIRWEIAVGELFESGELRVRLASQPDVVLVNVPEEGLSRFGEMLRRENRTFEYIGRPESKDIDNWEKVPKSWAGFAECKILKGNLVVILKSPDLLPFAGIESDEEQNEDLGLPSEVPQSLLDALECLLYWHPYHFTVRQVVPGSSDTAAFILKIRALGLLRKLADQGHDEFNFEEWWVKVQDKTIAMWPKNVCPDPVLWPEIRSIAMRSQDSDLVEFISDSL